MGVQIHQFNGLTLTYLRCLTVLIADYCLLLVVDRILHTYKIISEIGPSTNSSDELLEPHQVDYSYMVLLGYALNPKLDTHLNENFIFEIIIYHFLVFKLSLNLILIFETY